MSSLKARYRKPTGEFAQRLYHLPKNEHAVLSKPLFQLLDSKHPASQSTPALYQPPSTMTLTPPTQACACNTCVEARRAIAENIGLKKNIAHLKEKLADNDRQRLLKAKADRNNAFIFTLGTSALCCYGSIYWFHGKYVLCSLVMITAVSTGADSLQSKLIRNRVVSSRSV
jgi:hypothetical protein